MRSLGWAPLQYDYAFIKRGNLGTSAMGFPRGSDSRESACNAGDLGSTPGSGRSPGEGNGYPLQDSCLENPTDRGAWRAIVHGVTKIRTQLSYYHFPWWSSG